MKKMISFILVLLLAVSFTACGNNDNSPADINPILGTWEVKSPAYEASFTFNEGENGVEGTYKYYDYVNSNWDEFNFTVKEQTPNDLMLLIDEGTIDTMPYTVVGNHLYIDSLVFTNTETEVPTFNNISRFSMLYNDENYDLYNGLFMGMYIDNVEDILGSELSLNANEYIGKTYQFSSYCNYEAFLHSLKGDYYALTLGFDENYRLVHLQKQARYNGEEDEAAFGSVLNTFNSEFGANTHEEYDDEKYGHFNVYTWYYGEYVIELKANEKEDGTSGYFTVTYYYNPVSK